jgi:hypothetical protein
MSRPWLTSGAIERTIDASPETIYHAIADVTSTGDRSDECRRAAWLDDRNEQAVIGARFRGYNRSGIARWSRVCEIIDARPGIAFAFRTVPERWDPSRRDSTEWRYELTAHNGGTLVTHSYTIVKLPVPPFKALYGRIFPQHRDMRPAMQHTLDSLARSATRPATYDTSSPSHTAHADAASL